MSVSAKTVVENRQQETLSRGILILVIFNFAW
jgi:hypothetical protein